MALQTAENYWKKSTGSTDNFDNRITLLTIRITLVENRINLIQAGHSLAMLNSNLLKSSGRSAIGTCEDGNSK